MDDMVGLDLPYAVICSRTDRGNLATIVNLMQKTRRLRIDHLSHTWSTLKIIGQHPSKFDNIRSLMIEDLDMNFFDELANLPSEFIA